VKLAFTYHLYVKNSRSLSSASSATSRLVHQLTVKFSIIYSKGKGKGHPVTGHEGPYGEQRYSFTLSLTSALDRGGYSTPRSGRNLPPGKTLSPLYRRLGGLEGLSGRVRKISPPLRFDPRTLQDVASHYTG